MRTILRRRSRMYLWRRVDENTIHVNLNCLPTPPVQGMLVIVARGHDWVIVQRRGDDLYVNDRKVVFLLAEVQKTGKVDGYEVCRAIRDQLTLHPNIMDALLQNTDLLPDSWKRDENGRRRSIYFWYVLFQGRSRIPIVRSCYYFDPDETWYQSFTWFDERKLDDHCFAAVLERTAA